MAGSQLGVACGGTENAPPPPSQYPSESCFTATDENFTSPSPGTSKAVPDKHTAPTHGNPVITFEEGTDTNDDGAPVSKVNETDAYVTV